MIEAASAGRLDYSQANSNDKMWLVREQLILDALERQHLYNISAANHSQHSSAASCWPLGDMEGLLYNDHTDKANKALDMMISIHTPWMARSDKEQLRDEMDHLRKLFTARIGDPKDPEIQRQAKELKEDIARRRLESKRAAAVQIQQTDEINRKLKRYKECRSRRGQRRA